MIILRSTHSGQPTSTLIPTYLHNSDIGSGMSVDQVASILSLTEHNDVDGRRLTVLYGSALTGEGLHTIREWIENK